MKDSWPEILEVVKNAKMNAWLVVYTARPLELRDGKVLVLSFPSQRDVEELKKPASPGQGVGDYLKKAFVQVLGLEPALIARVDAAPEPVATTAPSAAPVSAASPGTPTAPVDEEPPFDEFPPTEGGWAVAAIPDSAPVEQPSAGSAHVKTPAADPVPAPLVHKVEAPASTQPRAPRVVEAPAKPTNNRYGESVVREMLGASFIEEQTVAPRVVPREES